MRPRLRAVAIVIALAACAASVWAQAPSSEPERTPRSRPSAGAGLPSAFRVPSAWALPSGLPSAWPVPSSRAGRSLAELAEAARLGVTKREDVSKKLRELMATRTARRAARVAELGARFNHATIDDPAFREELRVHSRRMAFLHRAELVAALELAEPKRTQTLERIRALTAKEERRHAARVETLQKPGSAAPKASAP